MSDRWKCLEIAARAYLGVLFDDYRGRWSVYVDANAITFCRGEHEKCEDCEWESIAWGGAPIMTNPSLQLEGLDCE